MPGLNGRSGRPYSSPQNWRKPNSATPCRGVFSVSALLLVSCGTFLAPFVSCASVTETTRKSTNATAIVLLIAIIVCPLLPQERIARRVVRAMDLYVAVCAATIEVLYRLQRLGLGWMTARDMARVANAGHSYLQQLRVIAAMRLVTIRAVLHNRR